MRPPGLIVCVCATVCVTACSHAWDDLDPRLAGGTGGGSSAAGGQAGSTSSSMTAAGGTTGQGAAAGSGGSGTGGMASGGMGPLSFLDDFDRADDPGIGNGWIEKTAGAFGLTGDVVVPGSADAGYRNNLVYRPSGEALLDVEASVEFDLTAAAGAPQMFVRVQYATIATSDVYDGYNIWLSNSPTGATLGRQVGSASSVSLQGITISPALTVGPRYRLRMSAQGTNPVMVSAYVEQQAGQSWNVIGSASYQDASAQRIDTAGAVGFARNANSGFVYDNFRYTAL
jgi:hypothetical protein